MKSLKQIVKTFNALTLSAFAAVFLAVFFFAGFGSADYIGDLKKQIEERQSEIKNLEEQIKGTRQNIDGARKKEKTFQNQINLLESEISGISLNIRMNELRIAETSLKINALEFEIINRRNEIDGQKNYLAGILRTIHEADDETFLEVILKNDDFSDFFNQAQYVENLEKEISLKLEKIKSLKDELESEKKDADAKRKYLTDLKNELSGQKGAIVDQQDEKEYLLKKTKSQEKSYQKMLSELEERQKEIQDEIFGLEDKLRFAIDKASIPTPRSGVLEWPAEGVLSQGYGATSQTGFINDAYKFHNGVDIAASYGTPIYAAQDGVIAALGNSDKYCYKGAYGKWITLRHNNGLTTLYAHLSSQSVSAGQPVKKGDLLGYIGSSGFSTGPHLHFTVYATNTFLVKESKSCGLLPFGGSVDPMDYL